MISYVLPTRDRTEVLARTLASLGGLEHPGGDAEVLVIDNASVPPAAAPPRLANGLPVAMLRLEENRAAAARNLGAQEARGEWLVMLDDDSCPLDAGFVEALLDAPPDVAAIGARITLPDGRHEAGGLPEVFTGCGVAIRRRAFLDAGGYDPTFHFYAEEYDLAARLLLAGHRVVHDGRFRVRHDKVASGRDMDRIVGLLVRNNGWVVERYAPDADRLSQLTETIVRYGAIAQREGAEAGYWRGLSELLLTLDDQPRRPMPRELFDRFTGLAAARSGLGRALPRLAGGRVCLVERGKGDWAVLQALDELGVEVVADDGEADVLVLGTLSPGSLTDAGARRRGEGRPVVAPWAPFTPPAPAPSPRSCRGGCA